MTYEQLTGGMLVHVEKLEVQFPGLEEEGGSQCWKEEWSSTMLSLHPVGPVPCWAHGTLSFTALHASGTHQYHLRRVPSF